MSSPRTAETRMPGTAQHLVALVLRAGSYTSAVLLATGLVLAVIRPAAAIHYGIREMLERIAAADATALMQAGILLLLITPVLRIAAAAVSFVYERDYRYAAISVAVLLIVISSILVQLAR